MQSYLYDKRYQAIAAAFILLVAVIGTIAWSKRGPKPLIEPGGGEAIEVLAATSSEDVVPTVPQTAAAARAGWRMYTSQPYHFSVSFPDTLKPQEYAEAQGALTLAAQDDTDHAFQVYVTPYSGDQITKERFRMDEPSGVMQEPQDVLIDGVRATMFFSKNANMGETREVWFIRGGYLYEVVTYKELDGWLSEIMSTWKFL
jgi:hypothetical protein